MMGGRHDTLNAESVHETLKIAFEELVRVSGNFEGLKMDTVFALGEALGILSKAKALVGRDVDDARERNEEAGPISRQDGA
jgi:hypothetical protein